MVTGGDDFWEYIELWYLPEGTNVECLAKAKCMLFLEQTTTTLWQLSD